MQDINEYANLDMTRRERTGYSEVVYCLGKTPEQVAGIMSKLAVTESLVIGTKATKEQFAALTDVMEDRLVEFHELAKLIVVKNENVGSPTTDARAESSAGASKYPLIAVVTAGTADLPIAHEAAITARLYGHDVLEVYDVGVAGIHRLLSRVDEIRKAEVIIVCAGMEGALPSVLAGLVDVPVIAVPTSVGYGASFQGMTALLSMLNSCSLGICVMNIDNGFGAAHLASMIARKAVR
jgi:NCAIR mutase (PurE)-related protein